MRRRTFLASAAAGTATGLAGCIESPFGSASSVADAPRLDVDGRWMVDPEGNQVTLRGVNVVDPWWGVEYQEAHGRDYWETIKMATDDTADWYPRIVRVPVEPRSIEAVGVQTLAEDYLDRVVELTRERRTYVIIDYHTVERYDSTSVDERIRKFWKTIAPRYADDPHVLYELYNEPTEPSADELATWKTWREHAQPWVDIVRENAPETPVLLGSPRWTSMAKYAPEAPFEGDPIVYTAHIFPSWGEETWESTFGAPATEVPLFVSEWGYVNVDDEDHGAHMIGTTDGYGEPFRQWLEGHDNVGWTAWSFSSEWKPYMFDDQWNLLGGNDHMGQFTKDWLGDTREEDLPAGDWLVTGETQRTVTTPSGSPPTAPANLSVTDRGPSAVWLSWDAATDPDGDGIDTYEVRLNESSSRLVDGGATATKVSGLGFATTYELDVVAVDERGLASDPSGSVTATTLDPTTVSATLPRATTAPTIDGSVDDVWSAAEGHAMERTLTGDAESISATWRGLWDDDALYWLVEVTDETAVTDSEDAYQDDSVEVYLDPDHSRESTYDRTNDANYLFRRGENEVHLGANSISDTEGIAVGQRETDDGWILEFSIPWSLFESVSPEVGHRLGLDVHANDDDDGNTRDSKIAWYATGDVAWENPQMLATAELGE